MKLKEGKIYVTREGYITNLMHIIGNYATDGNHCWFQFDGTTPERNRDKDIIAEADEHDIKDRRFKVWLSSLSEQDKIEQLRILFDIKVKLE